MAVNHYILNDAGDLLDVYDYHANDRLTAADRADALDRLRTYLGCTCTDDELGTADVGGDRAADAALRRLADVLVNISDAIHSSLTGPSGDALTG